MKPYILNIEAHDEVSVVTDRMDAAGAEKVLLVFPARRVPLTRRLDLKLLQRHAAQKGIELAVVASRGRLLENATDLGIPVFANIRQAQSASWERKPPRLDPPIRIDKPRRRLDWLKANRHVSRPAMQSSAAQGKITLAVSLLAVFGLLLITLPHATVRIQPRTSLQELHMTVSADPALSSFSLTGDLPAERITVVVEGRERLTPSGTMMVPLQPASGEVVFTNLSDQAIDIPSGVVLRTTGETPVRFSTQRDAELEAEVGANITVPVQALNPGSDGNLPPGSITIIEGDLKLFLNVTNLQATKGGSAQRSAAPSAADYENLSQRLQDTLWQTALAEAARSFQPGDFVIDSQPVSMTVLEESFDPADPQPTSSLSLQMQVEYDILVVAQEDMLAMAAGNLDATLLSGTNAYPPSLVILPESEPVIDENGIASWQVYAQRYVYDDIDYRSLQRQLYGKGRAKAMEILTETIAQDTPAQIILQPAFWPIMPLQPMRIQFQLDFD